MFSLVPETRIARARLIAHGHLAYVCTVPRGNNVQAEPEHAQSSSTKPKSTSKVEAGVESKPKVVVPRRPNCGRRRRPRCVFELRVRLRHGPRCVSGPAGFPLLGNVGPSLDPYALSNFA